jgi:DNA replication and repair protein RecF
MHARARGAARRCRCLLDVERRAALFEALGFLGAQVFMTGVDPEAFSSLGARAERFLVMPGRIDPAA